MSKYKVWKCKIIVPIDTKLPKGFDLPPRQAAMEAIEEVGIEIFACFSGWGGSLSKAELEVLDKE